MQMDILKSNILNQLARENLPAQNRVQLQQTYDLMDSHPHSNSFNNLGLVSKDLQQTSGFIHCDDMSGILNKFSGFDSMLGTIIDDAFGDSLDSIGDFFQSLGDSLEGMQGLQDGLSAVKSAANAMLAVLKTATDLISDSPDNPCLKQIAQKTYSYMPLEEKAKVDTLKNISSPVDRGRYMNQMMKTTSVGKFI